MLTKTDREIIAIVKETFREKDKSELINPDDLMREFFIKFSFVLSLVLLITSILLEENSILKTIFSIVSSIFFMLLFLQINMKSKTPSVIIFVLTYFSVMIPIWII